MTGIRFYRGRTIDLSAGCMFSVESRNSTTSRSRIVNGRRSDRQGFGGALGAGLLAATVALNITIATEISAPRHAAVHRHRPATDNRRPDNGRFGSGTCKVGAVTLTNVLFNGNGERQGAMLIQNAQSVLISPRFSSATRRPVSIRS
jgi:hypothetical protein